MNEDKASLAKPFINLMGSAATQIHPTKGWWMESQSHCRQNILFFFLERKQKFLCYCYLWGISWLLSAKGEFDPKNHVRGENICEPHVTWRPPVGYLLTKAWLFLTSLLNNIYWDVGCLLWHVSWCFLVFWCSAGPLLLNLSISLHCVQFIPNLQMEIRLD